jgi:hypothetical protein
VNLGSTATTVERVSEIISAALSGYTILHIWYEFEGRWELLRYNSQVSRLENSQLIVDQFEEERPPKFKQWGEFELGD